MLAFEHLSASYGKNKILDVFCFPLISHKITAIIGKNGSGKSTLVSCLNQELAYTGEILYSGQNLALMAVRERAKLLAILPQVLTTPSVTVEELTAFGRNPYLDFSRRLTQADREAVEAAMAQAGVDSMRGRPVNRLSGGERQKAFLAMILAQDTRILVLDEPTTYMDVAVEAGFFRLLQDLKEKRKKTLMVVLHNLSQALRYADYVAVLHERRVCYYGSVEECCASGKIEEIFQVKKFEVVENGEKRIFFSA